MTLYVLALLVPRRRDESEGRAEEHLVETTIDGVQLFYEAVGAEGYYPLLLLHGGPGLDHTYLRPWFDCLADAFRLLYVDLRGHGRSERVAPATVAPAGARSR